jgi:hypothetical protein
MSFCGFLKQSTAVNVIIGPFVSSTDGDTEMTGLTIAQADVRLSKNAAADAQKNDATTCAHEGDGLYMCELDATDTNTVGQLCLWVHVATALIVRHDFQITEEATYDALFAASALGPATPTNITAGTITTATNVTTVNGLAANVITAAATATDFGTEVANAVWDMDATGHQTTGTFGQAIGDPVADTTTMYSAVVTAAAGTHIAADIIAVKAQTAAIEVDTAEIGAAGAGLTNINLPNQTMDIIGSITGNLSGSVGSVTGAVGSVTAGVTLANDAITAAKFDESTAFPLKADDAGATQVARVGADGDTLETLSDQLDAKASQASVDDLPTNAELATALGTADDAVLAQIALVKVQTDKLTFTVANQIDANVQSINDTALEGDGDSTPWGPA